MGVVVATRASFDARFALARQHGHAHHKSSLLTIPCLKEVGRVLDVGPRVSRCVVDGVVDTAGEPPFERIQLRRAGLTKMPTAASPAPRHAG